MRRAILLFALVALVLASCGGGGDAKPSKGASASVTTTPSPSASPATVAMPEGTWTGEVHEPAGGVSTHFSLRITLPAACAHDERCGRQEQTFPDGRTCGGPLTYEISDADGAFRFSESITYDRGDLGCTESGSAGRGESV